MFYYTEGQMCQYLNQKEECDAIEAQHTQNKGGRPSPIKTDISDFELIFFFVFTLRPRIQYMHNKNPRVIPANADYRS